MVLILGTSDDLHIKQVIEKLPRNSYFIIYSNLLISRYAFHLANSTFTIYDKKSSQILEIEQVTKVWCRRITLQKPSKKNNTTIVDELKAKEALAFLNSLKMMLIDRFWLTGHPIYELRAQYKLNQIETARQLGFTLPKTCFSNDKKFILETFESINRIAVKTIGANLYEKNQPSQRDIFFYTALISKDEIYKSSASRIRSTINFVQEYIEKEYELRITVVDKSIFACKLLSSELPLDKGKIDFRQGYDHGLRYQEYTITEHLADLCLQYLAHYNLKFGCFDFVVDKQENIYFLECNSNGQWLWIEQEIPSLKISNSIINCLLG